MNSVSTELQLAVNKVLTRLREEELLCFIMAGGRGERLCELTNHNSKPAVQLSKNLIVDFTISNIRNSGLVKRSYILTQYDSQSLQKHVNGLNTQSKFWDRYMEILPAQKRADDENWYTGTANAVYQNHRIIASDRAEHVIVLAADHVYKLDINQYYAYHLESDADLTVCGRFMPLEVAAGDFGVIELSDEMHAKSFEEKPPKPKEHPSRSGECFGSMGIYIFKKDVLLKILAIDHVDPNSINDFGKNIIPTLIKNGAKVVAYDHETNKIPGETSTYWRDVGTLDAYHSTNMDLVAFTPALNLFNKQWPIITATDYLSSYKLMTTDDYRCEGQLRFMAAGGTVITNPKELLDVVIGRSVTIDKYADIYRSVILDDVTAGQDVKIKNAIIAPGISIPDNCIIGESVEDDKARNIRITSGGVRLVHVNSRL